MLKCTCSATDGSHSRTAAAALLFFTNKAVAKGVLNLKIKLLIKKSFLIDGLKTTFDFDRRRRDLYWAA